MFLLILESDVSKIASDYIHTSKNNSANSYKNLTIHKCISNVLNMKRYSFNAD